MTRPLNPTLYRMLKEHFVHVRISNQGVALAGMYRHDPIRQRDALNVIEPGEYYQVCCPFCNDTRFRLYINHMWGRKDELGSRNLWLASGMPATHNGATVDAVAATSGSGTAGGVAPAPGVPAAEEAATAGGSATAGGVATADGAVTVSREIAAVGTAGTRSGATAGAAAAPGRSGTADGVPSGNGCG